MDVVEAARDGLVIRPGDTLIIRYEHALDAAEVDHLTDLIRPHLPNGVKVMILDNCAGLAVARL